MRSPSRRSRLPLLLALAAAVLAVGLGVAVVHATRDVAPVVRPYDPFW